MDIVARDDDVATVDPDAENNAPIFGLVGIAFRHAQLNFGGAAHRIDDAGELDQHPVAHELDDTAVVLCDLGIDKVRLQRFERRERAFLVGSH